MPVSSNVRPHTNITMPIHTNSASRMHSLINKMLIPNDQTQILAGWVQVLEVAEFSPRKQAILVTRRLDSVSREIGLVRDGMSKESFSPVLYESALGAFEEAASPILLPHTWNNIRQYLTPQNILALQFCSEILPHEEEVVSLEKIADLLSMVEDLRLAAHNENLPESLRSLLLHHVELIERAIAEYPISGVKALREASQSGLGELVEAKEMVAQHGNTEEILKLAKVWKKVSEIADAAIKADDLLQIGYKAWNLIEGYWKSAA